MIYELMYIIPSKFSEEETEGVQKEVENVLKKHEAKIEKTENLGKFKFAYPIKGFNHGTYILTYIEIEGEKLAELDHALKLTNEVLRHLFVKREKGIPTFDYKMSSYQPPLTSEGKRTSKKTKPVAKPKPQKAEKKITTKELDEKLDEILESDIVEGV